MATIEDWDGLRNSGLPTAPEAQALGIGLALVQTKAANVRAAPRNSPSPSRPTMTVSAYPEDLLALAARIIWFKPPAAALEDRVRFLALTS
jgi:hypothetical protein